ncbi:MAG: hypothetical protein J2P17_28510, partial [Mycobacterium sp.]|nr:hypothetical protein [Mycobacterium sp.]
PGVAWLWCALLGIGLGVISHGFALITRTSPTAAIAANRSAMAQGIGYLLGSVGVLAVGDLHTTSHGWAVPVAFLLVVLAGQIICGLAVRHPGGVGR